MLEHTKKHLTKRSNVSICLYHAGVTYRIPERVADKYRVPSDAPVSVETLFSELDKQYTKPGALLRGIRLRENLTQLQMAKKLKVTQSDISQMENGVRNIGRSIAQRIEKLFGVGYRSFLQ